MEMEVMSPPPDLMNKVRHELQLLFVANAEMLAAKCTEACVQQVWAACLARLASQAEVAMTTTKFLPKEWSGVCVLVEESKNVWRVSNSQLKAIKAKTQGLIYRRSKNILDEIGDDIAKWGEVIDAFDEGDGWVRCECKVDAPMSSTVVPTRDQPAGGRKVTAMPEVAPQTPINKETKQPPQSSSQRFDELTPIERNPKEPTAPVPNKDRNITFLNRLSGSGGAAAAAATASEAASRPNNESQKRPTVFVSPKSSASGSPRGSFHSQSGDDFEDDGRVLNVEEELETLRDTVKLLADQLSTIRPEGSGGPDDESEGDIRDTPIDMNINGIDNLANETKAFQAWLDRLSVVATDLLDDQDLRPSTPPIF